MTMERNEICVKSTRGDADEVGERGAYRMVNRISQLLGQSGEFAGRTPGTGVAVTQTEQYRSVSSCP